MKKVLSLVLALALMVSICAVIPTASAKTEDAHYYVYTQNGKTLNLREQPNTNSKVLLRIPFGDEFYVFEFVNNDWAYGHWGGEFGYVMTRFLVTKKPSAKPTPSPKEKEEQEAQAELNKLNAELKSETVVDPSYYIAVRASRTSGWVNFRVGPSKTTSRIASMPDGKELKVVGKTTNWYKAEDPETGKIGYIHQNYAAKIATPVTEAARTEQSGKKQLGTLDVNGKFSLQCELPEGYDLQVVNMMGTKIIASILSQDMTKPQLYLTVAYDETYGDVERMNDLSDEDLALLESTFTEMNDVEITYRETAYGSKLLVAIETGDEEDFVDILSVYKGYFIEFNMTPNPKATNQKLTDEQVKMCIDFLTNLDFIEAT